MPRARAHITSLIEQHHRQVQRIAELESLIAEATSGGGGPASQPVPPSLLPPRRQAPPPRPRSPLGPRCQLVMRSKRKKRPCASLKPRHARSRRLCPMLRKERTSLGRRRRRLPLRREEPSPRSTNLVTRSARHVRPDARREPQARSAPGPFFKARRDPAAAPVQRRPDAVAPASSPARTATSSTVQPAQATVYAAHGSARFAVRHARVTPQDRQAVRREVPVHQADADASVVDQCGSAAGFAVRLGRDIFFARICWRDARRSTERGGRRRGQRRDPRRGRRPDCAVRPVS